MRQMSLLRGPNSLPQPRCPSSTVRNAFDNCLIGTGSPYIKTEPVGSFELIQRKYGPACPVDHGYPLDRAQVRFFRESRLLLDPVPPAGRLSRSSSRDLNGAAAKARYSPGAVDSRCASTGRADIDAEGDGRANLPIHADCLTDPLIERLAILLGLPMGQSLLIAL